MNDSRYRPGLSVWGLSFVGLVLVAPNSFGRAAPDLSESAGAYVVASGVQTTDVAAASEPTSLLASADADVAAPDASAQDGSGQSASSDTSSRGSDTSALGGSVQSASSAASSQSNSGQSAPDAVSSESTSSEPPPPPPLQSWLEGQTFYTEVLIGLAPAKTDSLEAWPATLQVSVGPAVSNKVAVGLDLGVSFFRPKYCVECDTPIRALNIGLRPHFFIGLDRRLSLVGSIGSGLVVADSWRSNESGDSRFHPSAFHPYLGGRFQFGFPLVDDEAGRDDRVRADEIQYYVSRYLQSTNDAERAVIAGYLKGVITTNKGSGCSLARPDVKAPLQASDIPAVAEYGACLRQKTSRRPEPIVLLGVGVNYVFGDPVGWFCPLTVGVAF